MYLSSPPAGGQSAQSHLNRKNLTSGYPKAALGLTDFPAIVAKA